MFRVECVLELSFLKNVLLSLPTDSIPKILSINYGSTELEIVNSLSMYLKNVGKINVIMSSFVIISI